MAIRDKARALFKSKSRSDKDSQLSNSSTNASDRDRWPSNVYRPGEPMPRPKYRAAPKKDHKENLDSFSFAEAWRRKSFQSQYSPMGTRAHSRRNSSRQHSRRSSWISLGRKSVGGNDRRSSSIPKAETESNGRPRETPHMGVARPPDLATETEQEGDDDVTNVGISRAQSRERGNPASRPRTAEEPFSDIGSRMTKTLSTAHDHQPFTEEDLALALKRSHLAVPA